MASRSDLDTLKVEFNTARAPAFSTNARVPLQRALDWPDVAYEHEPFRIVDLAVGPLIVSDLHVFAQICSRHLATPTQDGRVEVTLDEIVRWLGYGAGQRIGGSQRRLARASLKRLCAARFESMLRCGKTLVARQDWGLLQEAGGLLPGRGPGCVTLTAAMASQLAAGAAVLLDAEVMAALMRRSPLAARLWVALESDRLDRTQTRAIFASLPEEPPVARRMPAIADLLRIGDAHRRRTVARLRGACEAIEEEDPRYRLEVVSARQPEMWKLRAIRAPVDTETGQRSSRQPGSSGHARRRSQSTLSAARPERGNRA